MKKRIRIFCAGLSVLCTALWTAMLAVGASVPDRIRVTEYDAPISSAVWDLTASPPRGSVQTASPRNDGSYTATARLFGMFPLKTVAVETDALPMVALGGTPFGLKMYIDGVLAVGFSDVPTAAGSICPAESAGLKMGDVILTVDGTAVSTNAQVAALIERCGGRPVTLSVRRDGVEFSVSFAPALSTADGRYKAGVWVRDSSAGIGTMTFYMPDSGLFAGLGHAVCDVDTGDVIPLGEGEIVPAKIFDIKKGIKGTPGELKGYFDGDTTGRLYQNSRIGVYGCLTPVPTNGKLVSVKPKREVKTGAAQIYTTIEGHTPRYYDIEIKQVKYRDGALDRHMVIEITDPILLEKTGGIVQGMSGSPILQDGKLVGAVTHVFVSDPTRGYGIFAENMLETVA